MKTHYSVLGVPKSACLSDIKSAFRSAAMRWHPDRNPGLEAEANERFCQIYEAYSVLSDSVSREAYDTTLAGAGGQGAESDGNRARSYKNAEAAGRRYGKQAAAGGFDEFVRVMDRILDLGLGEGIREATRRLKSYAGDSMRHSSRVFQVEDSVRRREHRSDRRADALLVLGAAVFGVGFVVMVFTNSCGAGILLMVAGWGVLMAGVHISETIEKKVKAASKTTRKGAPKMRDYFEDI